MKLNDFFFLIKGNNKTYIYIVYKARMKIKKQRN